MSTTVPERISVTDARLIAIAAQGFGDPRPAAGVDASRIARTIDRLGVLQLDSVAVLCRSHYLPVFARLGPYPRPALDGMAWGGSDRRLFEYSAHGASLLPLRVHPLLRWRMQAAARWDWSSWSSTGKVPAGWSRSLDPALRGAPWAVVAGMTRLARERPGLVDEVLSVVAEQGPIAAGDIDGANRRRGGPDPDPTTGRMWNWQDAKIAIEWLFYLGRVTTATRRGFERLYDLTERVIPAGITRSPAPARDDAQRELVRIAARALGIATERHLRGHFGLPPSHAKLRVAELVDAGELVPVRVDGQPRAMFRWAAIRAPATPAARALLSPFDSLIADRDRTHRLFDFHYRISIYTPASQRVHGYYVMPFLLGDRLVARVDLRSDRTRSTLVVPAAHIEPGVRAGDVVDELAGELRLMARWLDLDGVRVEPRGDLAPSLAVAVAATA